MLIATTTGIWTEKPTMPSLDGVMLSPRRLSRKSKTAQSRLNSLASAIIRQRRAESACLIFVQKSEKGSLKIANPELYNQRRGAPGSGFAKRSASLLKSPRLVACETFASTRNRSFSSGQATREKWRAAYRGQYRQAAGAVAPAKDIGRGQLSNDLETAGSFCTPSVMIFVSCITCWLSAL